MQSLQSFPASSAIRRHLLQFGCARVRKGLNRVPAFLLLQGNNAAFRHPYEWQELHGN
jgi:hypothetical protein